VVSGNGFGGVVLDEFRNKIGGKGGKGASEEVFYGTDAVVAEKADL